MIRVKGSKSIICSKKELKMMNDLDMICYWQQSCYELPLFDLKPKKKRSYDIETDYVLIRPCDNKISQNFFDKINKAWNSLYESWN